MLAGVDCSVYGTCTQDPIYAASYLAGFWTFYAVLTAVQVWVTVRITRKAGYSPWLGLLGVVPIVGWVAILVFAFKEWPVESEVRDLRGRLAMAYAAAPSAGRPAVSPQYDASSRFGTPPQYDASSRFGTPPPYEAPSTFGGPPQYDASSRFGTPPPYEAPGAPGAPPQHDASSRFGGPPRYDAPSRFGTPPPPDASSRFGTPPPPAGDAPQPHGAWQPQQQPPQRW